MFFLYRFHCTVRFTIHPSFQNQYRRVATRNLLQIRLFVVVQVFAPLHVLLNLKENISLHSFEISSFFTRYICSAVLNFEEDIGIYTIKVATDPRACNRVVLYRPSTNIISQLELISLWEKKTGRTFKKIHVPEEEIVFLSKSKSLISYLSFHQTTKLILA